MNELTVLLGDEFDEALRIKLFDVLRGLGAVFKNYPESAVGGSQEVERVDLLISGQVLHVEAETYMGLSIRGPADLVQLVQETLSA